MADDKKLRRDHTTAPTGLAPYNADIDPTRLQPYGNPHARVDGIGVQETDSTKELRQSVAEELSDEGESVEEAKGRGGRGRRTAVDPKTLGEDVVPMKGSEGLFVDRATGRVLRESGALVAVLASPGPDMNPSPEEAAGVRESETASTKEKADKDPGTRADAEKTS